MVLARVRSVHTGLPGEPALTTFYFNIDNSSVQAQAAADAVRSIWDVGKGSRRLGMSTATDPFVAVIDPVAGEVVGGFTIDPGIPVSSTDSSRDALPRGVCPILRLKTPLYNAGRNLAGRIYWPGATESWNDSTGGVDSSYLNDLKNTGQLLIDADPQWVIWSRKNGTIAPVTSLSVAPTFGMLRSRRQ